MGDGAHQGINAERALETIIGGEPQPTTGLDDRVLTLARETFSRMAANLPAVSAVTPLTPAGLQRHREYFEPIIADAIRAAAEDLTDQATAIMTEVADQALDSLAIAAKELERLRSQLAGAREALDRLGRMPPLQGTVDHHTRSDIQDRALSFDDYEFIRDVRRELHEASPDTQGAAREGAADEPAPQTQD